MIQEDNTNLSALIATGKRCCYMKSNTPLYCIPLLRDYVLLDPLVLNPMRAMLYF